MRSSLLISLLLLSALIVSEVQGRRLKKEFLPSRNHKLQIKNTTIRATNVVVREVNLGKMKRRMASATKSNKSSSQHLMPSIHEDYYGPRIHRPKHH